MLLGIVKKHYDLLEHEPHQIDQIDQIAEDRLLSKVKLDNSLFHQYIKGLREKNCWTHLAFSGMKETKKTATWLRRRLRNCKPA